MTPKPDKGRRTPNNHKLFSLLNSLGKTFKILHLNRLKNYGNNKIRPDQLA